MKSAKFILIFYSGLILLSCKSSPEDHWKSFEDEVWEATIETKDTEHRLYKAETSTFLYFRTDQLSEKYAVFAQSDHPDLLKSYRKAGSCMTDQLSVQLGQQKCYFTFQGYHYIHITNLFSNTGCNLLPETQKDCTRLAATILNHIR